MALVALNNGRSDVARVILESLPQWFGRQDAREMYIERAAQMPMIYIRDHEEPIGFVSLLGHEPHHCEVFVMGVAPDHRGQGVGTALIDAATAWCVERHIRFLSVKTVADAEPKSPYGETLAFYRASGFEPFETFPDLWGDGTSALMLLKELK